jgi:hypothetical protein
MILVQHDGNLTVFGTEHHLNVQPDQSAQAFLSYVNASYVNAGWVNTAHHIDDPLLGDRHGVRHDVEQDFIFGLKVVIEAALGEFERRRHIIHGSGIVSPLLKETGGGTQDFLARLEPRFLPTFDGSFAKHHQRWYRGMNH